MFNYIKRITYSLGNYPQQSLRIFFTGLGTFFSGLAVLWHHQETENWIAMSGVIVIMIAVLVTLVGWIGIFAHRASQVIHRAELARKLNKRS
jgi:hypothetical protein